MRSFRLTSLIGLILLVFGAAACQPTDNPNPEPEVVDASTSVADATAEVTPTETLPPTIAASATPQQILGRFATDPAQISYVRLVHAAPGTPPVDVYIDSSPLVSGLEYGLASGRTNIINGQYTVYIVERGSEPPAGGETPANALVSAGIDLQVGASTLLVLTGTPDELTLNSFDESNEPLDSSLSRVSVIHAVPAGQEVTVQQNGETMIGAVGFSQRSESITLPNAETLLDFVMDGQTVFTYPFNPLPRTDYLLVFYQITSAASTDETESPAQYGVLAYDHLVPGQAEVRAINASTVETSLDVYLNGQPFTPNVGVNSAGERQTILDGQYTIEVYPAGADVEGDTAPLVQTQLTLLPDTIQALIITGGEESLQVQPFAEDLSPLAPDTARIAYLNALESAPAAQVGNDSAVRSDIGTIGFGQGSAYFPINIGVNNVFWSSSDQGLLEDTELEAEAGRSYLYFLTGNETAFVLSEAVEVDEALVDASGDISDILATPDLGTRVRIINVNEASVAIDFTINGTPVAEDLAFGESSSFERIDTSLFPITISQSGSQTPLLERDVRLADTGDTTMVVYGPTDNLMLLAISEQDFDHRGGRTTLRFINASIEETVPMGLIVTEPDPDATAEPSAETATEEAPEGPSSVPIGVRYLVDSQSPLTFSPQIPIPLELANFIIADNRSNLIGTRINNAALEQGRDYDIVAIYVSSTDSIRAVLIPYPEE